MNPARIPVIVGGGQIADREATTSLDLMARAILAAQADAGAPLLDDIDWLGIVSQISCPEQADMPALLPARLGIAPAHVEQSAIASGDSPMLLLNEAANAIGRGDAQAAVIVGGEALRNAGAIFGKAPEGDSSLRQRYGLRAPATIYPLYENACRAAWGQSITQAQAESAAIWSLMSQVAAQEPAAWLKVPVTAEAVATPDARNRIISWPYTKLMVANASVNQGAALIVTSLAKARELNIADSRLIYIGMGAAAHEADDPLARDRYDHSVSMEVALKGALAANRLEPHDLDLVELYSCFPCVPKMARRILDWPVDRPATCFGGLTFGGGPIANYMTHGAASMAARLRRDGGTGLLFANGGYATHNHAIPLSSRPFPEARFPHDYHRQGEATALRGTIPPIDDVREGPARIETYSLLYDRAGAPDHGVILARRPDGSRLIARIDGEDAALVALLTGAREEPIGMPGVARRGDDGRMRWAEAAITG